MMTESIKRTGQKTDLVNSNRSKKWDFPLFNKFRSIFLKFDRKVDGAISFFVKNYGKTRFMIAMSKRVQYLGIEDVFKKGPKAFVYFFLFYLIRDVIIYILIPIYFAKMTTP